MTYTAQDLQSYIAATYAKRSPRRTTRIDAEFKIRQLVKRLGKPVMDAMRAKLRATGGVT